MSEILTSGALKFTEANTPTRAGELIDTLSEIYDIPTPRLGMLVYVRDEAKEYIIRSLKSKVVGGVIVPDAAVDEYELASDFSYVEWSAGMSMNNFTKEGVYSIRGLRMGDNDNLPISNVGDDASFAARLFVTVTPEGTTVYRHIIGQTLILSNAEGNETKIYIRSGKSVTPNDESIEWSAWTMMQGNREVGVVESLDEFTDNGIYSGVWGKKAGEVETFVMVVINDYVVVGGDRNRVTQFKYAFNSLSASKKSLSSFMSRVCSADGEWSEWEILNKSEIDALVNNAITAEAGRAVEAETALENTINRVKDYAARIDGNAFSATANEVKLKTTGVDISKEHTVTLPAATETKAGVMTAEDKGKLDNLGSSISELSQNISEVGNSIEQQVAAETARAEAEEAKIRKDSVQFESLNVSAYSEKVSIGYRNNAVNKEARTLDLPAATETKAGVMTAADKKLFAISTNLYSGRTVPGYINSSNGSLAVSNSLPNAVTSEEIDVVGGKVYCLTGRENSDAKSIRCLKEDGSVCKVLSAANGVEASDYYLPTIDASNTAREGQFKVPEDATKVQFGIVVYKEFSNDYNNIVLEYVGDSYDDRFTPSEFNGYKGDTLGIKESAIPEELRNTIKRNTEEIATLQESLENLAKKESGTKKLKMLCFGNSFTQDSMSYVPFILKNIAPDLELTLGICYIGGCVLAQHYSNFSGETNVSVPNPNTYASNDTLYYNPTGYAYYKFDGQGAWAKPHTYNPMVDELLQDDDWDIVTFQQGSAQAGGTNPADYYDKYYQPFIYKLHKLLFDKIKSFNRKSVKIGWLSIHGSGGSLDGIKNNYNSVISNSKKVEDNTATSVVFAYGTAVQNLRTIDEIANIPGENINTGTGEHYVGLLADGSHLQDGLGCLCAAYYNALKILECAGINNIGIIGESTVVDVDFIQRNNIPGTNPSGIASESQILGIKDDNGVVNAKYIYLAQAAAHKAMQKPYEVTDLNSYNV